LNRKRAKIHLWPFAASAFSLILIIALSSHWPIWLLVPLVLAGTAGTYVVRSRDILEKTVVLFYEFDLEMEAAYTQLHSAASKLAGCAATWHIEASGRVHDPKYHAGASNLVRRNNTFIRKSEPPYVKTNIETIAVGVGRQTLHFFPDRVFVYDRNGVGAVGYGDLRIDVSSTRFIESASVPKDSKVVDRTWEYVNKSGGPDRRFKDNRELPICQYEEITISSQTGLNEVLQVSRCGFGSGLADAISMLGKQLPKERSEAAPAM
jgi:hypothetical protein